MEKVICDIRVYLKSNADEKIRLGAKRYFKEEIKVYGLKTDEVAKLARERFKALKVRPKAEIFALCGELWQSGYLEEGFIACNWAYALRKKYVPDDFATFERWVDRYVSNWAACDTLCNHTIGTFVEMHPGYVGELKRWARSHNRWMRRAAAVTLIVPAKRGLFLKEIFAIADILLKDPDDLVQKGYGWMLKAASQAHEVEVFHFVMGRKATMPRTALRYAIEKMSKEHKAKAMKKQT